MTFKHPDFVELKERAADPAAIANSGFLYTKDLAGVTQLYYMNQAGTVIPLVVAISGTPRGTLVQAGRPTITNSATEGFQAGDRIFDTNTNVSWVCRDALAGNPWWVPENAAGWKQKVTLTAYAKLIAWWDCDEAAGDALDRRGQLNGGHSALSTSRYALAGKTCDRARYFGTTSYLCGHPDDLDAVFANGLHIMCWVKMDAKANYEHFLVLGNNVWGGEDAWGLRYNQPNDRFAFYISADGVNATTVEANTFGSPATATWYFVEGYWDGATAGIAVNAGAYDTAAFAGPLVNPTANGNAQLCLGGIINSFLLTGLMQSVGLFNAKLTTAERDAIYNAGAGVRMLGYGAP